MVNNSGLISSRSLSRFFFNFEISKSKGGTLVQSNFGKTKNFSDSVFVVFPMVQIVDTAIFAALSGVVLVLHSREQRALLLGHPVYVQSSNSDPDFWYTLYISPVHCLDACSTITSSRIQVKFKLWFLGTEANVFMHF